MLFKFINFKTTPYNFDPNYFFPFFFVAIYKKSSETTWLDLNWLKGPLFYHLDVIVFVVDQTLSTTEHNMMQSYMSLAKYLIHLWKLHFPFRKSCFDRFYNNISSNKNYMNQLTNFSYWFLWTILTSFLVVFVHSSLKSLMLPYTKHEETNSLLSFPSSQFHSLK